MLFDNFLEAVSFQSIKLILTMSFILKTLLGSVPPSEIKFALSKRNQNFSRIFSSLIFYISENVLLEKKYTTLVCFREQKNLWEKISSEKNCLRNMITDKKNIFFFVSFFSFLFKF